MRFLVRCVLVFLILSAWYYLVSGSATSTGAKVTMERQSIEQIITPLSKETTENIEERPDIDDKNVPVQEKAVEEKISEDPEPFEKVVHDDTDGEGTNSSNKTTKNGDVSEKNKEPEYSKPFNKPTENGAQISDTTELLKDKSVDEPDGEETDSPEVNEKNENSEEVQHIVVDSKGSDKSGSVPKSDNISQGYIHKDNYEAKRNFFYQNEDIIKATIQRLEALSNEHPQNEAIIKQHSMTVTPSTTSESITMKSSFGRTSVDSDEAESLDHKKCQCTMFMEGSFSSHKVFIAERLVWNEGDPCEQICADGKVHNFFEFRTYVCYEVPRQNREYNDTWRRLGYVVLLALMLSMTVVGLHIVCQYACCRNKLIRGENKSVSL